jgi:uncharacterized protein
MSEKYQRIRYDLSEDQRMLLAHISRENDAPLSFGDDLEDVPTDIETVSRAIIDVGYGDWFLLEDNISTMLDKLQAGVADVLSVAQCKNGQATVTVSDDEMTATLEIMAPYGGRYMDLPEVERVLERYGVRHGINISAVENLTAQSQLLDPGKTISVEVAYGSPSIDGDDSRFSRIAGTAEDRGHKPKTFDDGHIDIHDFGEIPIVNIGDPLLKRLDPTPGIGEQNVYGVVNLPTPGATIDFDIGEGATVSRSDPSLLVAMIKGQPIFSEKGASVDPVYQVDQVDMTTGNIVFEGSVVVKGDVAEDMKIEAEGDISVSGQVYAATLTAGRSIAVANGILGHAPHEEPTGREITATIKAGGRITARFVQFSELTSGDEVLVQEFVLHSNVKAKNRVQVGDAKTAKGKIIGGSVGANTQVCAGILGAPSSVHTAIDLSDVESGIRREMLHAESWREELTENMEQLQKAFNTLHERQKTEASIKKLRMIGEQIKRYLDEIEKSRRHHRQLQSKLAEIVPGRVKVFRESFIGVSVKISNQTYKVKKEMSKGVFQVEMGRMKFF